MKTILLLPTYNGADILLQWFEYVRLLDPQPDRYIFLENNSKDETLPLLVKEMETLDRPTELLRVWFRPDANKVMNSPYMTLALVRQLLIDRAKQRGFDYVILCDDDTFIISPDAITKVTQHKLDIVGGPYMRPFPQGMFLATKFWTRTPYTFGLRKKILRPLESVAMTSGGFLALSSYVLSLIDWFPPPQSPIRLDTGPCADDFGFCHKAIYLGFRVWLDGTIELQHCIRNKPRPWDTTKEKEYIKHEL